jgi:hypothetical protein
MRKLASAFVLGVFGVSCGLAWAMTTLMLEVRNAGRVLPHFTNLCIRLRPLLIILPIVAAAYWLWLWFDKEEKTTRRMGFVVVTMALLIVFVLPAIGTSYLLMIDPVKLATGAH